MTEQNEIEEMAKVLSTLPLCEIRGARPHTKMVFKLVHIAEHLYTAGYRKQPEWISVEERLPEVEQIVLCCLGLVQNVYTYKGDNTWEDSYGYWQKDEPITHWMPLPMPPKGDEGK